VATPLLEARRELALGNRIVANEGVLDAFGHVSMRHPENPNRYFLSRSRAPQLVAPDDFIEYDLESQPIREPSVTQYSERVIHGEIYKARPEVMSVCHHHSPAFMPLLATGTDYVPVFHLGAVGGIKPPFWDQHDEFGDTNMLVVKPEEGRSLARALGRHSLVLMNRHGATVVGGNVQELVFRTVYSCRNAEFQYQAQILGKFVPLHRGEIERAASLNSQPNVTSRTWEYWAMRLERSGNGLKHATAKATPKTAGKGKTSARTKGRKR
jgi:HCOMODA/2-hydroxy-3-carboxy-muconic semialdehyde decarboxylase